MSLLVGLAFAVVACADEGVPISGASPAFFPPIVHSTAVAFEPLVKPTRAFDLRSTESPPGDWAARAIGAGLVLYEEPGGRIVDYVDADNAFGQKLSFLVTRWASGASWIRIETGDEPNGAAWWVPVSHVRLVRLRERIVVDLSQRRLWRFAGNEVLDRLRIAVGKPSTPTVPGRYFVWAHLRDYQSTIYGPLVLGLSGFSEVVRFGPIPGRLAIHGTADPTDRGQAVSLGCVRVWNAEIADLWSVPMGTPVMIRR